MKSCIYRIKKISRFLSSFKTNTYTKILKKRFNGIHIGAGTKIYYKSYIHNNDTCKIVIGNNCLIGRSETGYHAAMPFYTTLINDGIKSEISIGDNCRINGAYIHSQCRISIGDNCVVASGVNILDSNGHQLNSTNRTVGRDNPLPIIIGNNVWIGINAIILKGSVIGDNCIVAAGSVVKGTFPENTIIRSHSIITEEITISN